MDPFRFRARVENWPAGIYDGDTFRLDIDFGFRQWGLAMKFRLADVNAPSIKGEERPDGLAARDWVRHELRPEGVDDGGPLRLIIAPRSPDPVKYGRYLADVFYRRAEDTTWRNLAGELMDAGHAEPYP